MLNAIKNLFFPKYCLITGQKGALISKSALKYLEINQIQRCHICSRIVHRGFMHEECKEKSYLDGLIHFAIYDEKIEKLIEKGKYSNLSEVFVEIGIILKQFTNKLYNLDNLAITYVPLHKKKMKMRGYNQAEIIAQQIGQSYQLIQRIRNTKTQVGMSKEERDANLINAFEPSEFLKNNNLKKVLLIDDVYTTGNTMNLCSKVLKENGVEEVFGLCFAKSGLQKT